MDPSIPLIYALAFFAFYLLIEGLYHTLVPLRASSKGRIHERLMRYATRFRDLPTPDEPSILVNIDEASGSPVRRLIQMLPQRRGLEVLLHRAGMPLSLVQTVVLSLGLAVAGFLGGLVLFGTPAYAAPLLAAGAIPLLVVQRLKVRRMAAFEAQFPEAMELLCRALRAGHSLQFGFQMVGDELDDPIASEFAQVADEISLGMEARTALSNLAHRMNTSEMPFFMNALMIQRETGGNLAEILENLGHVVRERLRFNGKVKALVSQMKLTATILALVPVAMTLLVWLTNPEYLDPMLRPGPGRYLLILAGVLVLFGYALCRRFGVVRV